MKKKVKELRHLWHGDLKARLGKMESNMASLMSFANNYTLYNKHIITRHITKIKPNLYLQNI